jgi:ATP-dependent RNA helicase DDX19/DBP5
MQCPPKGKFDFLAKIFKTMVATQCIIFVNTRSSAEKILYLLNKQNCSAVLMFGRMDPDEQNEIMNRFRKGEAKTIITTNMLARGIDVPEVELVINFDVPILFGIRGTLLGGDTESYLYRICRTGRFGTPGIALTLLDGEQD